MSELMAWISNNTWFSLVLLLIIIIMLFVETIKDIDNDPKS